MQNEQQALRAAFSCYYSGNFTRGFRPDRQGEPSYVQKVVAHALGKQDSTIVPAVEQQSDETPVIVRPVGRKLPSNISQTATQGWAIFEDAPTLSEVRVLAPVTVKPTSDSRATPNKQNDAADGWDSSFAVFVD
jgi:type IV secretion system protein VirB1